MPEKLKYETPELRVLPGMWKGSLHHRMIVQVKSERDAFHSPAAAIETITALTLERMNLLDALRDLLKAYDRASGMGCGEGYSTADVQRLEEIRKLVQP